MEDTIEDVICAEALGKIWGQAMWPSAMGGGAAGRIPASRSGGARPHAHLGPGNGWSWGGEGAGVGARRRPAAVAATARAPVRGGRKGGKARRGEVLRAPRKLLTRVVARGRSETAACRRLPQRRGRTAGAGSDDTRRQASA
jgi:hypothetical protein